MLNPFHATGLFVYPSKQKASENPLVFWSFQGGLEKDQSHKMGQTPLVLIPNLCKTISVLSQPEITCSKLTIKTPKEGVKYVQS